MENGPRTTVDSSNAIIKSIINYREVLQFNFDLVKCYPACYTLDCSDAMDSKAMSPDVQNHTARALYGAKFYHNYAKSVRRLDGQFIV